MKNELKAVSGRTSFSTPLDAPAAESLFREFVREGKPADVVLEAAAGSGYAVASCFGVDEGGFVAQVRLGAEVRYTRLAPDFVSPDCFGLEGLSGIEEAVHEANLYGIGQIEQASEGDIGPFHVLFSIEGDGGKEAHLWRGGDGGVREFGSIESAQLCICDEVMGADGVVAAVIICR